jgi:hypothetical protein
LELISTGNSELRHSPWCPSQHGRQSTVHEQNITTVEAPPTPQLPVHVATETLQATGRKKTATKKSAASAPSRKKGAAVPAKPSRASASTTVRSKRKNQTSASVATQRRATRQKETPYVDQLLGKVVGFYCNSEIGEQLMQSFGRRMCEEAKCRELNSEHGHILGTVMRIATTRESNKRGNSYEIAWEYTELGESVIEGAKLVDAAIIGSRIQSIRRNNNGVSDKETA